MKKSIIKKLIISIIVALLIEIFVCNFAGFRTLMVGNCKEVDYEIEKIEGSAPTDGRLVISNIGVRVTSINIEYEAINHDALTYFIVYKTTDNEEEVSLKEKVVPKDGRHYVNFDSQSECEKIFLNIVTRIQTAEGYKIKSITINSPNFNISIFRIILIFAIIVFILVVKNEKIYTIKYDKNSKLQHHIFIIFLSILCIFIFIYTMAQNNFQSILISLNDIDATDATLMQTEAFVNNSVKLLVEPSEKLINMEDPYNYGKKTEENIPFLFDIAYYDGAYYSYFGVAPIFLLILPFRMITGIYLRTYIFNLIFIFAIIFLLYSIYRKLIDKYVKDVSLFNFYIGYITMFVASNILNELRGTKYEISITCGIMCILLAIRLAISINEKTKFEKLKLIILRFKYRINCIV